MKNVIVTMLATTMMVSAAFAGSVNDSIDFSVKAGQDSSAAGKFSTNGSVKLLDLSMDGTQALSKATTSVIAESSKAFRAGVTSVEGVSVKLIQPSTQSDSKIIQFIGNGLTLSVTLSADISRAISSGAELVLTRTAEGIYVLVIKSGTAAQDVLQLDVKDAVMGLLKTPAAVIKAMGSAKDEVRETRKENRDQ
jgi:hypothetical protein